MSRRFDALNRSFNEAGIGYAVLKGLSLVPQFCPYAPLRHQGDFDYLVDARSLSAAQRVLVEAGYVPKDSPSRQEFIFVTPGAAAPSRSGRQYPADAPHAVELHLDVWDSDQLRLPTLPNLFTVERVTPHEWNGFVFPALTDEDAFLLQVVHACQHLFALVDPHVLFLGDRIFSETTRARHGTLESNRAARRRQPDGERVRGPGVRTGG